MLAAMSKQQEFLRDIERFLRQTGMAPTTFGLRAVGRLGFVARLQAGGGVLMPTEEKVREFMRTYRPHSAKKKRNDTHAA